MQKSNDTEHSTPFNCGQQWRIQDRGIRPMGIYNLGQFSPKNWIKMRKINLRRPPPQKFANIQVNMKLVIVGVNSIITGRNEVLAKVIFSEACVILSTGGGSSKFFGGVPPNFRGVSNFSGGGFLHIFGGGGSPIFRGGGFLQIFGGVGSPPEHGHCSAGTHPTGMHSCLLCERKLWLDWIYRVIFFLSEFFWNFKAWSTKYFRRNLSNIKEFLPTKENLPNTCRPAYDFDLDCDKYSVASYTIYPGPTYRVYNRHGSRKYPQR